MDDQNQKIIAEYKKTNKQYQPIDISLNINGKRIRIEDTPGTLKDDGEVHLDLYLLAAIEDRLSLMKYTTDVIDFREIAPL